MKNKKYLHLTIEMTIFVILYFVSKQYLSSYYVFEWTAHNNYAYLWAFIIVLIMMNKIFISYIITIGNILGLVIGQFVGDHLRQKSLGKITLDMNNEQVYALSYHKGIFIWFFCIIILFMIGTMLTMIQKQKKK